MKNKYFGDVGDFGKFGLLTALSSGGLKLGVNWYLTMDDEKNDGRFIEYLQKSEYIVCDTELHSLLNDCITGNRRNVSEIKRLKRFEDVPFYDKILQLDETHKFSASGRQEIAKRRNEWFENSIEHLSGCDLIFCDPDNGVETRSLKKAGKESVKYVFKSEIERMVDRGFSLVLYNHRDRSSLEKYKSRIQDIYGITSHRTKMRVVRFNRYSQRDYIVLMQKEHSEIIEQQLNAFLQCSRWQKHFGELII